MGFTVGVVGEAADGCRGVATVAQDFFETIMADGFVSINKLFHAGLAHTGEVASLELWLVDACAVRVYEMVGMDDAIFVPCEGVGLGRGSFDVGDVIGGLGKEDVGGAGAVFGGDDLGSFSEGGGAEYFVETHMVRPVINLPFVAETEESIDAKREAF